MQAKKMYGTEVRSITPDVPDNVSEAGSTHGLPENKYIREKKVCLEFLKDETFIFLKRTVSL